MNEAQNKILRRDSAELKRRILAECARPVASVASVALSHGINANAVRKWRRLAHDPLPGLQASAVVPLALPRQVALLQRTRVELRRGATSVSLYQRLQPQSFLQKELKEWRHRSRESCSDQRK